MQHLQYPMLLVEVDLISNYSKAQQKSILIVGHWQFFLNNGLFVF